MGCDPRAGSQLFVAANVTRSCSAGGLPDRRPSAESGRALVVWNLRRLRVKRGVSQERLAYDAEVDRSYVGGLERQAENPTVDVLDRLAATLYAPLSEIFKKPRRGASPPKPLRNGRKALR